MTSEGGCYLTCTPLHAYVGTATHFKSFRHVYSKKLCRTSVILILKYCHVRIEIDNS